MFVVLEFHVEVGDGIGVVLDLVDVFGRNRSRHYLTVNILSTTGFLKFFRYPYLRAGEVNTLRMIYINIMS